MSSSARIEELQKKYDENPRRYFAPLANEFRKAGDAEQAIAICREHLPQQPGHMSGHIVFGQALFEAGQLDESRSVFETALALDPENLIALRHLGDIASRQGNAEEARSWYTRVLEADPRNAEIASLLANLGPAAPSETPAQETVEADRAEVASEPAAGTPSEDTLLDWETEIDAEPAAELPRASSTDFPVQGFEEFETVEGATEGIPDAMDPSADELFMPTSLTADAASDQYDSGSQPPVGFEPTHSEREPFPEDYSDGWATGSGEMPAAHEEGGASAPEEWVGSAGAYGEGGDSAPEQPEEAPDEAPGAVGEPDWDDQASRDDTEPAAPADVPPAAGTWGQPTPPAGVPAGGWTADMPTPVLGVPIVGQEAGAQPSAGVEEYEWEPLPEDAATVQIPAHSVEPETPALPEAAETEEWTGDAGLSGGAVDTEWTPTADSPIVTETMAELYLQQGHLDEALSIYQRLVEARPDDSALRERMEAVQHAHSERASRTMRNFLSALASRQAVDWGHEPTPVDEQPAETGTAGAGVAREAEFGAAGESPSEEPWEDDTAAESAGGPDYAWDGEGQGHTEVVGEMSAPERSSEEISPGAGGLSPAGISGDDEPASPEAGSIDRLFGSVDVSAEDEAAATALADVFTTAETKAAPAESSIVPVAGRPARPATTELSLDQVFRPAGATEQRRSGNFSFDQFFAGDAEAPRTRASDMLQQPAAASQDDVEQFNAWLKDLKQR